MINILQEALIGLLSGLTTKRDNEIHWKDKYDHDITIEPIDITQCKYIFRCYHKNGQKHYEIEYQNGQPHGKYIWWWENGEKHLEEKYRNGQKYWAAEYKNGQKLLEAEYQNGQLHGKYIWWWENGQKHWETEYKNGQMHGKNIGWNEDGQKHWESEYQDGIKIKDIL